MSYFEGVDFSAVIDSFRADLQLVGRRDARKNIEAYEAMAYQLSKQGNNWWTHKRIEAICNLVIDNKKLNANTDSFFELLNADGIKRINQDAGRIAILFYYLLISAAKKKILVLPIEMPFGNFTNKVHQRLGRDLDKLLPRAPLELLIVRNKTLYHAHKADFTLKWDGVETLLNTDRSSWGLSSLEVAKYMFSYGLSTFKEIDVVTLNEYRLNKIHAGHSQISVNMALSIIDRNYGSDLASKYAAEASKVIYDHKQRLKEIKKGWNYKPLSKSASESITGQKLSSCELVYSPSLNSSTLWVSDWSFNLGTANAYNPKNLESNGSLWIKAQLDFIKSGRAEMHTQKTRKSALTCFNVYLFSYLPHFFQKTETIFEYPNTPEMFKSSVFVEYSHVVNVSLKCKESLKQYPMSIIDFVVEYALGVRKDESDNLNYARDALATIKRLFDYMMRSYGTIEGINFKTNPLAYSVPKLGTKYSQSVKPIFEPVYWLQFRVYVKLISKCFLALTAIEFSRTMSKFGNKVESIKLCELAKEICDIEDEVGKIDFDKLKGSTSSIIKISKEIKFFDDHPPLIIEDIEISAFNKRTAQLVDLPSSTKHADYQHALIVAMALYAGQRASNSLWLDARNFDKFENKYQNSSMTKIFIATDKIQSDGLESHVDSEIFRFLKFAKTLRSYNKKFAQPIYYQGSENSKFNKILPLLQLNDKNVGLNHNLSDYLIPFEECLKASSVDFKSCVFTAHPNTPPNTFLFYKGNDGVPSKYNYLIADSSDDSSRPFSPLKAKTNYTIHGTRTTFVSYVDLLLPNREAFALITGQRPATVGYYSKATPKQAQQLKALKIDSQDIANNVVSADSVMIDQEQAIKAAASGRFAEAFECFTSSHLQTRLTSGLNDIVNQSSQISFNWTHICPFGNRCPNDVISEIGEGNCHLCPKAIISKHNGPGIAARLKFLIDELKSLKKQRAMDGMSQADKEQMSIKIKIKANEASCWYVRLNYINENMDLIVGDKEGVIEHLVYTKPSTLTEGLLARLVEVANIPALQSDELRKKAVRLSRNLMSKMDPDLIDKIHSKYDGNPVALTVANLKLMADMLGKDVAALLEEVDVDTSDLLLEFFE